MTCAIVVNIADFDNTVPQNFVLTDNFARIMLPKMFIMPKIAKRTKIAPADFSMNEFCGSLIQRYI